MTTDAIQFSTVTDTLLSPDTYLAYNIKDNRFLGCGSVTLKQKSKDTATWITKPADIAQKIIELIQSSSKIQSELDPLKKHVECRIKTIENTTLFRKGWWRPTFYLNTILGRKTELKRELSVLSTVITEIANLPLTAPAARSPERSESVVPQDNPEDFASPKISFSRSVQFTPIDTNPHSRKSKLIPINLHSHFENLENPEKSQIPLLDQFLEDLEEAPVPLSRSTPKMSKDLKNSPLRKHLAAKHLVSSPLVSNTVNPPEEMDSDLPSDLAFTSNDNKEEKEDVPVSVTLTVPSSLSVDSLPESSLSPISKPLTPPQIPVGPPPPPSTSAGPPPPPAIPSGGLPVVRPKAEPPVSMPLYVNEPSEPQGINFSGSNFRNINEALLTKIYLYLETCIPIYQKYSHLKFSLIHLIHEIEIQNENLKEAELIKAHTERMIKFIEWKTRKDSLPENQQDILFGFKDFSGKQTVHAMYATSSAVMHHYQNKKGSIVNLDNVIAQYQQAHFDACKLITELPEHIEKILIQKNNYLKSELILPLIQNIEKEDDKIDALNKIIETKNAKFEKLKKAYETQMTIINNALHLDKKESLGRRRQSIQGKQQIKPLPEPTDNEIQIEINNYQVKPEIQQAVKNVNVTVRGSIVTFDSNVESKKVDYEFLTRLSIPETLEDEYAQWVKQENERALLNTSSSSSSSSSSSNADSLDIEVNF